ncbi:MAG TPA: hypothetical protein VF008_30575, partial [Niastella sp.]
AQQKHFEEYIGWRGNKIELHTISNKSKDQSCTFVVDIDSIRAFVFNNEVAVIQQFNFACKASEKVLGGFIRDSKVYFFTEQKGKDMLHNWVLDITTGNIKDYLVEFDLKKEKVVDYLNGGDRFLYFTARNKTSEFIIYNFTGEQQWDTLRYAFNEGGWDDITALNGAGRSVSVQKVDLEGECSINTAVRGNKLYPRNDTLFLVMNNHRDSTHVYSFDLVHKKVNNWVIKHHTGGDVSPNGDYSDNSFLLRNKLYYLLATLDSLCIQVVDLYTGVIKRSYVANKEDDISFKNTPIVQEGGTYSFGALRELGKTKQLLRKLVNGDAVITATLNANNQVEIIVGSFAKMTSGFNGGMVKPAGGPGSSGVAVPAGGFYRNTWLKSAHFKMLLNADTFEHVEGAVGNSINARIEYYTIGVKIPWEAENLFMTNGRYYHAYYDKTLRKLVILKF